MKTVLALLIVILALIGISDAGYISYTQYAQVSPKCGEGFDCDAVLNSPYAEILGIPLAYIGLFFYSTVFIFGILNFLELDFKKFFKDKKSAFHFLVPLDVIQVLTTFGFIFSLYLVFVMGVLIGEWCKFCLISAGTSLLLFITTLVYEDKFRGESSIFLKSLWFPVVHWVYTKMIKPIYFQIDPEQVHVKMVWFGSMLANNSLSNWALRKKLGFSHPSTRRVFNGIEFPNPVGLAAGFDYNADLTQALPAIGFGWHSIGTITLEPYQGNPQPRLGRFPNSKSLIVNKGLKNLGARDTIAKLEQKPFHIPTGISIASTNKLFKSDKEQITDIIQCFALFEASRLQHSYYELNISCPNTFGGEPFTTPLRLEILLTGLDKLYISRPVYVKMPIDQSEKETLDLLKVIDGHHTQGVIMGNLTKDKTNPAVTPQDRADWQHLNGNLSGKPTFDRSNNLIALTRKHYKDRFTIIGTGGIFSAEDAMHKLDIGADLVQLITGMIFEGPQTIGQINLELSKRQ